MKMGKGNILVVILMVGVAGFAGYNAPAVIDGHIVQTVGGVPIANTVHAPQIVRFDTSGVGSGSGSGSHKDLSPILKVTKYIDGDTIYIAYLPKTPIEEKLRFLQIDTPERGEPLYDEAGQAVERLVLSAHEVYLEFPSGVGERDRYGRLLCYLVTDDGRCINVEVVRLGYSTYWTKYGRSAKYEEAFKAAEAEAKAKKLGIWGLSPEEFKKVDAPKKPAKKK